MEEFTARQQEPPTLTATRPLKCTRRELFRTSLLFGGAILVGIEKIGWPEALRGEVKDEFQGGTRLGVLNFEGESHLELETMLGTELDGRLYTDLSSLTLETRTTPTEKFYIRTGASPLLDNHKPWVIRLGGQVERPTNLGLDELQRLTRPAGLHLMECAGNSRAARFGMLSVAEWKGAPLPEILGLIKARPEATHVLISGFDEYVGESKSSLPGASWIFSREELQSSKAFLATQMNGAPLSRDHGAPVRLLVPGWYGCACIKWVNEVTLVNDEMEATSQMREYAARTLQQGVRKRAKSYHPAVIDQAAMPVRVEQWLVGGKTKYRVVGILWGGSRPVNALEIRFNPEEDYVPVDSLNQVDNDPWSFWTHAWEPKQTGRYLIRLRVKDPPRPTRRLDAGYYVRSVEIAEI